MRRYFCGLAGVLLLLEHSVTTSQLFVGHFHCSGENSGTKQHLCSSMALRMYSLSVTPANTSGSRTQLCTCVCKLATTGTQLVRPECSRWVICLCYGRIWNGSKSHRLQFSTFGLLEKCLSVISTWVGLHALLLLTGSNWKLESKLTWLI